jgi:predicted RNA-binding Zn-ribbon protein involved in translation (DUF1610 family)
MMTFFPTPYPDEILYSVFARYHEKSPNFNGSETAGDLFSVKRIVCSLEFPTLLANLVHNMPLNSPFDVDSLIVEHTLFPYYTVFLSLENREIIRQYMWHGDVEIYNKITGITNPLAENKFLRFCPRCNEEDFERYGELYWHRVHQIRGIYICPYHKIPIYNSSVLLEDNKYKYVAATEKNCIVGNEVVYEQRTYEKLLLISEDMCWILNNQVINTNIKEQYSNRLKILEYATVNGSLRQKKLIADFEAFWGSEILQMTHNTIRKTNNSNWLLKMGWNKATIEDPLKHILFMRFLGLSPEVLFNQNVEYLPFGKGPYPCLNPVCKQYKKQVIENVEIRNSYKNKSPIGYFTCPNCGFSYLRRGPDTKKEDKYRYSRIVDFGDYWREELIRLLKYNSVPTVAKLMGTSHTTVYDFLRRNENNKHPPP